MSRVNNSMKITKHIDVVKTDAKLGYVFGWGVVSKTWDYQENAFVDFYDSQGDNIPEDDLIEIAKQFVDCNGNMNVEHDGLTIAKAVYVMPITEDIMYSLSTPGVAKSAGLPPFEHTGILIGVQPPEDIFKQYVDGSLNSFSIEGTGTRIPVEDNDA